MKELNSQKVFVQYRDIMEPYGPVKGRLYTITHSDITAELFVFVAPEYAKDQFTKMHDEVKIALIGSVIVDGEGVTGDPSIRNKIFYNEMPTALQALRQADRFLFEKEPDLDHAPVYIQFISGNPEYNKTYDFGVIGMYQ